MESTLGNWWLCRIDSSLFRNDQIQLDVNFAWMNLMILPEVELRHNSRIYSFDLSLFVL